MNQNKYITRKEFNETVKGLRNAIVKMGQTPYVCQKETYLGKAEDYLKRKRKTKGWDNPPKVNHVILEKD